MRTPALVTPGINNFQSNFVALGTLEDALSPIQVHFHSYRGRDAFKTVSTIASYINIGIW